MATRKRSKAQEDANFLHNLINENNMQVSDALYWLNEKRKFEKKTGTTRWIDVPAKRGRPLRPSEKKNWKGDGRSGPRSPAQKAATKRMLKAKKEAGYLLWRTIKRILLL